MGLFDAITGALESAVSNQQNSETPLSGLVKQLYENSNDDQKHAMVKHVVDLLGPQASDIASKSLGIALPSDSTELSPDQVAGLTPEQVQSFIALAHQQAPQLTDHLSSFYSQHADLIKSVGGVALAFINQPKKSV